MEGWSGQGLRSSPVLDPDIHSSSVRSGGGEASYTHKNFIFMSMFLHERSESTSGIDSGTRGDSLGNTVGLAEVATKSLTRNQKPKSLGQTSKLENEVG